MLYAMMVLCCMQLWCYVVCNDGVMLFAMMVLCNVVCNDGVMLYAMMVICCMQ